MGVHANPHRFRHTFATWVIENLARELDVQYLLGHSTSAMVRRYSATYDAAKATEAHATLSPAARLARSVDEWHVPITSSCLRSEFDQMECIRVIYGSIPDHVMEHKLMWRDSS